MLVPALQIAEILMEKLPGTFSKMFVREGVLHAIDALIVAGSLGTPSQTSNDKDNDSVPGSSRSRRYRKRVGNSNADLSSAEDTKNLASIGSPPNSIELPSVNSSLRVTVSSCAKSFKDKYFPSDPEATEVGITDDLLHLKNLCMKLNVGVDEQKTKSKGKSKASAIRYADHSATREENLVGVIAEILGELSKGDGVSTFEFIGSGVVAALLNYFTCGYFSKDRISEANLPKLRQQAIRRYKSFVTVALPTNVKEASAVPMSILIQKLQNALSSLERFPVVLSHTSRSSSLSSRPSGLSALSQPFKLRLCRAQGEKSLRDYSSNVVLIDPLASLAAVEDFLWPRIQRSESGQKPTASAGNSDSGTTFTGAGASSPSTSTPASTARRHSTRSRSSINIGDTTKKDPTQEKGASSSKGKGKAVLKSASEEGRGPQTRNAARRRAALDRDAQIKPVNEDSSSEVCHLFV